VSVQLLDGEINFNVNNESFLLKPGQIIALHRNVPHSIAAIKESVFLLTVADFLG
jgi:quercetin dioxygenase-like cupin family protein